MATAGNKGTKGQGRDGSTKGSWTAAQWESWWNGGSAGKGGNSAGHKSRSPRWQRQSKLHGKEIVICSACPNASSWAPVSRNLRACRVCDCLFDYSSVVLYGSDEHWRLGGWEPSADNVADTREGSYAETLRASLLQEILDDPEFGDDGGLAEKIAGFQERKRQQDRVAKPEPPPPDPLRILREKASKLEVARANAQRCETTAARAEQDVQEARAKLEQAEKLAEEKRREHGEALAKAVELEVASAAACALPPRAAGDFQDLFLQFSSFMQNLARESGQHKRRAPRSEENTRRRLSRKQNPGQEVRAQLPDDSDSDLSLVTGLASEVDLDDVVLSAPGERAPAKYLASLGASVPQDALQNFLQGWNSIAQHLPPPVLAGVVADPSRAGSASGARQDAAQPADAHAEGPETQLG